MSDNPEIKFPEASDIIKAVRVDPGKKVKLSDFPTRDEEWFDSKRIARASCVEDALAINELQDRLYADRGKSLLVVLQGMDTAGKSGTIKSVFAYTSPQGLQVAAFKKPTEMELAHDYLWRVHSKVPRKGFIGIFDRSHYEDVLVVKVRNFASKEAIEQRYDQINAFEQLLTETGTRVMKFMLNISPEEQKERLISRLEEPHKRWKFNPGDLEDRKLWPEFMDAYETMLERCSTGHAPWHVIPSDSKSRRNAIIARIVRQTLEDMDPTYPDPGFRREDFDIR